jgi:hypothetical protein
MKLCLLMNTLTLIYICILVFPIGIIEVSTKENEVFYFISVTYTITDIQSPEIRSWGEMERCEKRAFQLL